MDTTDANISQRAKEHFGGQLLTVTRQTDRIFGIFTIFEWVGMTLVLMAVAPSPASFRNTALTASLVAFFPVALAFRLPAASLTRHVIAASQMIFAGMVVHLSAHGVETR